jgi:3D-(3,5/4)-trihydroxycyclohexane-1,2-dione acylhydrolase (decyclizing)
MMSSEIVTSIQEGYKLTIILMDNSGFKSIGSLSRSLGQDGFGTRYVFPRDGALPGDNAAAESLPVDLAANARGLGACVLECRSYSDVVSALESAREMDRTTVIYVRNDRMHGVPGYESWWDVPVAETSTMPSVREARSEWEEQRARERYFF